MIKFPLGFLLDNQCLTKKSVTEIRAMSTRAFDLESLKQQSKFISYIQHTYNEYMQFTRWLDISLAQFGMLKLKNDSKLRNDMYV